MSSMNDEAGDCMVVFFPRSNARLKFAAVTGLPSENLKPFLTVNVYVLPPFETFGMRRRHPGETVVGRALRLRVVQEREVRRAHHVPRVAEVGETRIDVVEVAPADLRERPALLGRGGGGSPPRRPPPSMRTSPRRAEKPRSRSSRPRPACVPSCHSFPSAARLGSGQRHHSPVSYDGRRGGLLETGEEFPFSAFAGTARRRVRASCRGRPRAGSGGRRRRGGRRRAG